MFSMGLANVQKHDMQQQGYFSLDRQVILSLNHEPQHYSRGIERQEHLPLLCRSQMRFYLTESNALTALANET